MLMVRSSRRPLAALASMVIHVVLAVVVVAISSRAAARGAASDQQPLGWQQLVGDAPRRSVGPDALEAILGAPDGVAIRLLSTNGTDAVGLAWWSPSQGMWLAVDRVDQAARRRRFDLWVRTGSARSPLGTIEIDEHGSGRMIARLTSPAPPSGFAVTLDVTPQRRAWVWRASSPVLTGTAQVSH